MSDSPANSLTEQWGHDTFQISEFWADYGQTAPYCLNGFPVVGEITARNSFTRTEHRILPSYHGSKTAK